MPTSSMRAALWRVVTGGMPPMVRLVLGGQVAVLLAVFESAFGASAWMDLPRLNLLEPVPAGQVAPAAGAAPVMFAFIQSNGTFKL